MMDNLSQLSQNYQRIERAIAFLSRNFKEQPNLDEIAASVHLSKYHFQRIFKRWAGITPTQFAHFLTLEYAKERLRESSSILDTSLEAGLSSPGRLHDLFVTFEAVTPGEYKGFGRGLEISYGYHPTPFGECLLGITQRGICALRFVSPGERPDCLSSLMEEWPDARFIQDQQATRSVVQRVFSPLQEERGAKFHLLLKGTNFQVKVWQALLDIPTGALVTYQDIAKRVSKPAAARAAANAIARNPVAYLIPCHRVIASSGKFHRYRWGETRKKAMLGWEGFRTQAQP
jgi:AraC family transcriptional regulator of adaptative response/methylated-DNA-[protein]-cysteine methyltransferase